MPGAVPISLNSLLHPALGMAVGARFILLIRRACSSHDQHEPLLHGDHSSNNVYGVPTGRTYTVVIPYGVPLLIPRIQGASTVRVIYRFTLQCTPLLMGYSLFCYSGDEGGILPPHPKILRVSLHSGLCMVSTRSSGTSLKLDRKEYISPDGVESQSGFRTLKAISPMTSEGYCTK